MSRRKSILSALVLTALCLSVVGVTNAAAAETGYTLHQCEPAGAGTGVLYTANCAEPSPTGTFETVPIGNEPVTARATGTTNFTLSEVVGGVRFTITCTGLEASPTVQNVLTGEFHHVTDEGATTFTGCSVTAPAGRGCTVSATLTTQNLKSDTTETGSTVFEPAVSGEPFIIISVTGCSSEALNGNKPVTGKAESGRETATKQTFSSTSGSELKFGGQVATFTGTYHLATTDGTLLSLEKGGE